MQNVSKSGSRASTGADPAHTSSKSLLVQGDQLVESGRRGGGTGRGGNVDSQRSTRSGELSPHSSQEDRLQQLELQVGIFCIMFFFLFFFLS